MTADPELAHLRQLTEIGRALTYTTSLDQVAHLTVERGASLIDAAAVVLMLSDADGSQRLRAAHGVTAERLERFGHSASDDVIGRLQGLLPVPDECFLAVPLVVGGSVTGLLAAALGRPFVQADEWLLSALADQAAVALENARVSGEVRIEMEDRLRASEGATNAKDRALATLAHDIRSPLSAIEGYCVIMEDEIYGPITDRQREALGRVRMSGRHLLSLLDTVMDMARFNAGIGAVATAPVRLLEVAREAVDILMPAAMAKRQTLALSGTADIVVLADRARARQVLVNLIGNAVKFTPEEGVVTVTVAAPPRTNGTESAVGEVQVMDTGPGIPKSEQTAIFEPYYRSEGTAALPGIGLGLAISQLLVTQMGGALALRSESGQGATFTIRLPVTASAGT
jgi:sigma-B regulation protein RsbU (phosphoserine phosphatase)